MMEYPFIINKKHYCSFAELACLVSSGITSQSEEGKALLACFLDGIVHKNMQKWASEGDCDAAKVLGLLPDISPEILKENDSIIMAKLLAAFGIDHNGESINIDDYVSMSVSHIRHGNEELSVDKPLISIRDKTCDLTISVALTKNMCLFETLHLYFKMDNRMVSDKVVIDLGRDSVQTALLTIKDFRIEGIADIHLIAEIANNAKKVFKRTLCCNYENGHEWVDLGLPSGLKWATCNVGATTPEGYGDYFAWGETSQKDNYDWETYKFSKGSSYTQTKYCTKSRYGYNSYTDNKTTLEISDDAARANWGGRWRMPSVSDYWELCKHCRWTWSKYNNVKGYQITSLINDNSMFLPITGYRDGTNLCLDDLSYWSSSIANIYPSRSIAFSKSSIIKFGFYYRYIGHQIRAVCC